MTTKATSDSPTKRLVRAKLGNKHEFSDLIVELDEYELRLRPKRGRADSVVAVPYSWIYEQALYRRAVAVQPIAETKTKARRKRVSRGFTL